MAKPKKILNDPKTSVDDFIQGLLLQYPNHLVKLENHHVLLLAPNSGNNEVVADESTTIAGKQKVSILSGGGSGHEPSHAGWIGRGMLTGAVCGGIFASPSVASILAAIRAAHGLYNAKTDQTNASSGNDGEGGGGVLLIIKNYTGDRLNFGMAAERAQESTVNVEMVVVADDCALPREKGITGARGVAGTVLVHKIAGAAAAQGQSLEQVAQVARFAAAHIGTLGIALNAVTVPGAAQTNDRLIDDETIEIGLGIHGEAGMKKSPLLTADEMAATMVATIQAHGRVETTNGSSSTTQTIVPLFEPGDEVCLLINNLGGTSNFEMSILAKSCVSLLESDSYGVKARRVLVGSFMTSFDMHGVSLTILNVSGKGQALLDLLDAPTNAPAWPRVDVWNTGDHALRPSCRPIPEVLVEKSSSDSSAQNLVPMNLDGFSAETAAQRIKVAMEQLAQAEALLTQYDVIVGDGDCGTTMHRGATEILRRLQNQQIPTHHVVPLLLGLAEAVSASMGGTSGILIELLLRKMASTLKTDGSVRNEIGPTELCRAFEAGVQAVSFYGGAQVGSRTMLDALVPAATVVVKTLDWTRAAQAARDGANATAHIKVALAGRSNYMSEEALDGTPDPGAIAVAIVLESLVSE